jgi:aryl-alcohol dehydrogenase-like predicted oxidoreductase
MGIQKAPFGRTGHESTRVLFGAAALGAVTQAEADRTFDVIVKAGINHIDTAASYGEAEDRIRPWLARAPGQFFLATKSGERTKDAARKELERSLERMGVDHVDLWQLHNLVDQHEWDTAFGPGGALEAAVAARDEGLIRFIGVTGHGLEVAGRHRQSLQKFDFDSVLLPYNSVIIQNDNYAENFDALVATCAERNTAVQTIKSIAAGPWGDREHTRAPWYVPLEQPADIDLAVWWVLGRPGIFLNSVSDVNLLPLVLDAASRYSSRPSDDEMQALISRSHMEPLFVS